MYGVYEGVWGCMGCVGVYGRVWGCMGCVGVYGVYGRVWEYMGTLLSAQICYELKTALKIKSM